MTSLAAIIRSLAGGAILAPLLAFGHASEFIVARLTIEDGGEVGLQMVADYAQNPLMPDAAAAESALREVLRVVVGETSRTLGELAPVTVRSATEWPADTPASLAPPKDGQAHQLAIATWRWHPGSRTIAFEVPRGSHHDVLLWRREAGAAADTTKWLALIAGDRTPLIEVLLAGDPWLLMFGVLLLVLMALLQARRGKRRARRMTAGR